MLDMPLEDYPEIYRYCRNVMFQSFLCWICLWKSAGPCSQTACCRVSILLMLDMPLEVITGTDYPCLRKCFNPSYAGYASGRMIQVDEPAKLMLFQSFLCWICLWKPSLALCQDCSKKVSILLMLDMPLEDRRVEGIIF